MKDIPAFPVHILSGKEEIGFNSGMTLRDYFAGQALITIGQNKDMCANPSAYTSLCYKISDAMLTERDKNRN